MDGTATVGRQGKAEGGKLRSRFRAIALLVAFSVLIGWQIALQRPEIGRGMPYEGYDEISTYNTARVLSGPTADWAFRYGTLDTLIQVIANQYFLLFDPIGRQYQHYDYSNNDPDSLDDQFYAFGRIKPDDFGYNYFRGLDDHRPIFLSRMLHFYVFYGVVAVAGLIWVAVLGLEAAWLLVPMLALTASSLVFEQAGYALPNGINTILTFAIVALCSIAIETRRDGLLYAAAIALAVALNFKVDIVPLGAILGLAVLWRGLGQGPARTVKLGAGLAAVFFGLILVMRPDFVTAPGEIVRWLSPPIEQSAEARNYPERLLALARFMTVSMLPTAWQPAIPPLLLPGLFAGILAALGIVLTRAPAALRRLVLPAVAVFLLWLLPIVYAAALYPRYFLNGLAAFHALLGLALLAAWRHGARPGRIAALVVVALLVIDDGLMLRDGAALGAWVKSQDDMVVWGEGNHGYSHEITRNLIEWHAVATYLAGGFDRTILVDQHGYLDLRMLRLAGMNPVYVNARTLDRVLGQLDRSIPHLVIYAPGSYATDPSWWQPWMRRWPLEWEQRYDAYLARLSGLTSLVDLAGPAQRLVSPAPLEPNDRMILAALPAVDPAAGQ